MMPATKRRSSARLRIGSGKRTSQVDGRSRHVLFVQGGGAGTHDAWDNKLVASLREALGPGYTIRYPRMPDEANPDAAKWKEAVAHELTRIGEGVILVGHSVGAAILLDYLGHRKRDRRVAGVFLIAVPYIGEGGWPSEDLRPTRELALNIDDEATPLFLYQGTQDDIVPVSHIAMLAKALPRALVRRLEGRNHQLDDDLSEVAHDIRQLR
jgi:predicted alpha/beta hydrolase family esterase